MSRRRDGNSDPRRMLPDGSGGVNAASARKIPNARRARTSHKVGKSSPLCGRPLRLSWRDRSMRRVSPFAVLTLSLTIMMMTSAALADDDWCSLVAGGPSGRNDLPLDLSAAHAAIRFFGTAGATADSDLALSGALDAPDALLKDGKTMLQTYAERLVDVCFVPTDNRTLGPVRVALVGGVALVRPGTGPGVLPPETLAVAIDLRHLPNTGGIRSALEEAVAPALAHPVPRATRRTRSHEGLPTELVPYYNAYYAEIENHGQPSIPAGAQAAMP